MGPEYQCVPETGVHTYSSVWGYVKGGTPI